MATPLDTSLLQSFDTIFPFLFVFVIVYGILDRIKLFSSKSIQAMIAFILAIMTLLSPIVTDIINTSAPWFILLFVFIIFTLVTFMAMGSDMDIIKGVITGTEHRYILFWVLALVLIIIFGSLSSVIANKGGFGNKLEVDDQGNVIEPQPTSDQESDFWATLFNPRILGMILILLISLFAVQRLTKD